MNLDRTLDNIRELRLELQTIARQTARQAVLFERLEMVANPYETATKELESLAAATESALEEIRALQDHEHDWKPIRGGDSLQPNAYCTVCRMETFLARKQFTKGK